MAKGVRVSIDDILEMERNLADAYRTLLKWIPVQREAGWSDREIRNHLGKLPGLRQDAINHLMRGEMPRVDVVERLEATVSRGGSKPHKKATATV